jgi:hypothetical protein
MVASSGYLWGGVEGEAPAGEQAQAQKQKHGLESGDGALQSCGQLMTRQWWQEQRLLCTISGPGGGNANGNANGNAHADANAALPSSTRAVLKRCRRDSLEHHSANQPRAAERDTSSSDLLHPRRSMWRRFHQSAPRSNRSMPSVAHLSSLSSSADYSHDTSAVLQCPPRRRL